MPITAADVGRSPKEVVNRPQFNVTADLSNPGNRISVGRAPDGTPALQMNIPQGENKIVSFRLSQFGNIGVDKACLSVRLFLQSDFSFGTAGTKLGLGLWGGTKSGETSGGVPPSKQTGWTVRDVNSAKGMKLYSYHLNRGSERANGGKSFGGTSSSTPPLPKGRWVNLQMEVIMNSAGQSNGSTKLWMDGKLYGNLQNLVFRRSNAWAIRGLAFTDMWGGNTKAKKNHSPKAQKMWYADYKLYK